MPSNLDEGLQVKPKEDGLHVPGHGTVFRVIAVKKSGERAPLPMVLSPETNKFFALFDEDGIDFEIQWDNELSEYRGVRADLGVHDKIDGFMTRPKMKWNLEAMETKGSKFHFLGESNPDVEAYVGSYATDHGLTYAEAAKILGRITFKNVMYSKIKSSPFTIFVETLSGKTITLDVESCETILGVKSKIKAKDNVMVSHQVLMFKGSILENLKKLHDYGIKNHSTLRMSVSLSGGMDRIILSDFSALRLQRRSLLEGEPGIIVFGEESDQILVEKPFDSDHRHKVQDFVVELRMKPKYKF